VPPARSGAPLAFNLAIMYLLYESSSGYSLFEKIEDSSEEGNFTDLAKFGKLVKLTSFQPFKSAAHALENINDVSEGLYRLMHDAIPGSIRRLNSTANGQKASAIRL
jgi:hypothetical protein